LAGEDGDEAFGEPRAAQRMLQGGHQPPFRIEFAMPGDGVGGTIGPARECLGG